MYLPAAFREEDPAALAALVRARPLATLVTTGPDGPFVNHVPLLPTFDAAGRLASLAGHLARANPQWRHLESGGPGVAVFHGPDAYVSASWCVRPEEQVPTWNYAVVHAHGRGRVVHDPEPLLAHLRGLSEEHESGRPAPWSLALQGPALERLLQAIVGIELVVTRVEGKFKLAQNRAPADRAGVSAALAASDAPESRAIAALMRRGTAPAQSR